MLPDPRWVDLGEGTRLFSESMLQNSVAGIIQDEQQQRGQRTAERYQTFEYYR